MANDRCEEKVNSPAGDRTNAPWPVYCGFFVLPFLALFWLCPFLSPWTIGNDYPVYHIQHQMELMFSLRHGTFPLFVPGFAGGHTASALTQGQIFHPISHLAAWLPGYWNGAALQWNTFLRLLTLGLAHAGLYFLLRRFELGAAWAFLLSFITVYNLRMLDLFRYGSSLESWTGFLFLCSAIGLLYRSPSNRYLPFAVIGSTYWLICSGHPQMAYYGLLGAGLFAAVIPFFSRSLPSHRSSVRPALWVYYARTASYLFAGILLASAYTLPFRFDYLAENAYRIQESYAWADSFRDSFAGTLNNFLLPLHADVHGSFGGSALILMGVLIPALRLFGFKMPRTIWLIWFLVILIFLYLQGGRTPIHYFAWKYLPFGSSMRIAGRIAMILPVFFMLLLTWMLKAQPVAVQLRQTTLWVQPSAVLAALALMVLLTWFLLPSTVTGPLSNFSPMSIRQLPQWFDGVSLALAVSVLFGVLLKDFDSTRGAVQHCLLPAVGCAQVVFLLAFGTWVQPAAPTPRFEQMLAEKRSELTYRQVVGSGNVTKTIQKQVERSFLEPNLAKIYPNAVVVDSNDQAYRSMKRSRYPDTIVLERLETEDSMNKRPAAAAVPYAGVELVYGTFNRVRFTVHTSMKAYLGLGFPFSTHWQAYIDDARVPVYRANGGNLAVSLPEGRSQVEFRYSSPASFWGMLVSCGVLGIMGAALFGKTLERPWNYTAMAAALIAGSGLFILWYNSTLGGRDIGTHYQWEYSPVEEPVNLAYGKSTAMSSRLNPQSPFLFANGQAVDGEKGPGKGFVTGFQSNPWWMLDLYEPVTIAKICIYEGKWSTDDRFNQRPLRILGSLDGRSWSKLSDIEAPSEPGLLELNFDDPPRVKFVLIKAKGRCHLTFDEIEVYSGSGTVAEPPGVEEIPALPTGL